MKKIHVGATAVALLLAATPSFASVDYSPLTGAVSAGDITTGVLAISGVLALVYATVKGAKIVLGLIR